MAEPKEVGKWGATVTKVIPATIDKVWAVLGDFDGIQRNFPQFFGTCETVEGEKNKPGSVRVVTTVPNATGEIFEGRERLLDLDDVNHTTHYLVEYISFGWTGFEANISCESVEDGHTLVTWTYEMNPTSTTTEEDFIRRQSGFYVEVLELTEAIVA